MPQFFALTSRGLTEVLEGELRTFGFDRVERVPGGVYFETNWEGCYRANLKLRTATRVVLPILDFPSYNDEDLYHNVQKHDYTKYIDADGTVAVEASVRESVHTDSRFVAMRVKDAVVDQFREKFGERPDVDPERPDLMLVVRVVRNNVQISIDTSGSGLFKRGYRKEMVTAPLKEHLAAGLLELSGWDAQCSIVDPMCGSGTILIEGALKAMGIGPGTLRSEFGFQRWKTFQKETWNRVVEETLGEERAELPFKFYGYDIDSKAIRASKANAAAAGVSDLIDFKKQEVSLLEPPCERGLIIVNPPYGERLDENVKDTFRDLGYALRTRFPGWTCWLLSGSKDFSNLMGLKSSRRMPVFNGPIECRFLKYEIRKAP